jgi:phosphohistidine swiveling domain-containing protein
MSGEAEELDEKYFPILRGESVGEHGVAHGFVYIVKNPEELKKDWPNNSIVVLKEELVEHFRENPGDMDELLTNVSAVIAEFGEPISDLAAVAYNREAICVVKVADATFVLEDKMHIRVVCSENLGEVFFID